MNVHFPQVERKSQLSSYLLAAFAVFTVLMLSLSFIRMAELRISVPSMSIQTQQTEYSAVAIPVRAPLPPVELTQTQANVTPGPAGHPQSVLVPHMILAPAPSVP